MTMISLLHLSQARRSGVGEIGTGPDGADMSVDRYQTSDNPWLITNDDARRSGKIV